MHLNDILYRPTRITTDMIIADYKQGHQLELFMFNDVRDSVILL